MSASARILKAAEEYAAEMDKEHWCMRVKHGECTKRACLVEGGYEGGGFNPDIATCPRWRLQEALDSEG